MKAYKKPKSENLTAALKEYNRKREARLQLPRFVSFNRGNTAKHGD